MRKVNSNFLQLNNQFYYLYNYHLPFKIKYIYKFFNWFSFVDQQEKEQNLLSYTEYC